jgi:ferredoxin
MHEPVYEKLSDALSMMGGGLPAVKCPEFYALLKELFTPEEADLASKMPQGLVSAADMAKETSGDPKVAGELLESMANKGVIMSFLQHDVMHYNLLQLVPGIFEMQFLSGEVSERAKRIAQLFDDYLTGMMQTLQEGGTGIHIPQFPWARVIAVESEVPAGVEIQPYDRVSQHIENASCITVSTCYCRHKADLLGDHCDKPKDNCIGFGPRAKANADRGFSRLISKEEAHEILKRSVEAGLVHCVSNNRGNTEFICNCCICHCGILQSLKEPNWPSMGAVSSFIMAVDEEKCMGCGDCIDRCPMDVLSMQDDIVVMDADRCIGCGLCVSVCPTEALRMEPRPDPPLPPWDQESLDAALKASAGTDSPSS